MDAIGMIGNTLITDYMHFDGDMRSAAINEIC